MSRIFCVAFAFVALACCVNAAEVMVNANTMCMAKMCMNQYTEIKNFSGPSVIAYLDGSGKCAKETLEVSETAVKFTIVGDGIFTTKVQKGCYDSVNNETEHGVAYNYDRDIFYLLNACPQMVVNIQCDFDLFGNGVATNDRFILVKKMPPNTPKEKCCYQKGLDELKNRFGLTYSLTNLTTCLEKLA